MVENPKSKEDDLSVYFRYYKEISVFSSLYSRYHSTFSSLRIPFHIIHGVSIGVRNRFSLKQL